MAPGKNRKGQAEKIYSGSFRSKAANQKATRSAAIKKAKEKTVSKKKLKEQTSRQIEDVNGTFADLRNQLVQEKSEYSRTEVHVPTTVTNETSSKETPETEKKQEPTREVTQEEVLETAQNIASL